MSREKVDGPPRGYVLHLCPRSWWWNLQTVEVGSTTVASSGGGLEVE